MAPQPNASRHAAHTYTRDLERRVAEHTLDLQHQQLLLSQSEAIAHIGSWRWSVERDRFEVSDEILRIWGVERGSGPMGMAGITQLIHPDDRERVRVAITEAAAARRSFGVQFRIIRPSGEIRHCWEEGRCDFGPNGEVQALSGICQDITERVLAEIEAQESNERYRQLVENSPDGVLVLIDGKIVYANKAAHAIVGARSKADILGKSTLDFVHPDDLELAIARRDNLAKLKANPTHEFKVLRIDGSTVDVEVCSSSFKHQGHVAAQLQLRDVTEVKAMREQLHQALKMEAVGQLTGGLAHDFNNLLSIIIGNLDLLQVKLADRPDVEALLGAALRASLRGADLTRQLLAFSRRQRLEPRTIQLNDIVGNVSALVKRSLGESIVIETQVDPAAWPVEADPAQLESAIVNLTINSRDAMPQGGRVTIATHNTSLNGQAASDAGVPEGDYVSVSVSDTGSGIPPEMIARVFEPFFTTKEVGKGTGLGLSMVYGFVKQSGGFAKIDSEVGRGTTVTLVLPRSRRAETDEDEAEREPVKMPLDTRVLVVEDNSEVRAVVAAQLGSLGFQLVEADSAVSAIQLLERGAHVDLLFTDVVMPGGISGIDLANQVQQRWPHIRVLFTSGFTGGHGGTHTLPAGAQLLKKPYRQYDLLAKICDVMGDPS